MAQMHFYIPDDIAARIKAQAKVRQVSVSRFLADLVKRQFGDAWPDDYFESVYGAWEGGPLVREPEGEYEAREPFEAR